MGVHNPVVLHSRASKDCSWSTQDSDGICPARDASRAMRRDSGVLHTLCATDSFQLEVDAEAKGGTI